MLSIRNKEPPISESGLPFSQTLPLEVFCFYLVFELEITTNTNSHTIPECNEVQMVHESAKKKGGIFTL
jgi:hypothetical protein